MFCFVSHRTSDAPQPLDPKDPESLASKAAAAAAANGGGSGNSIFKPSSPGSTPLPQIQHSNSYNMVPTQPYSPALTPGIGADQQRMSMVGQAPPVSGPYPSYQQPYGQA